jgi:hypothetical protein
MSFQIGLQGTLDEWVHRPLLDNGHWLVRLGDRLPWVQIAETLRRWFSLRGREAKQVRLVVGLLMLKHLYDLADRVVVDGVHENLYRSTTQSSREDGAKERSGHGISSMGRHQKAAPRS